MWVLPGQLQDLQWVFVPAAEGRTDGSLGKYTPSLLLLLLLLRAFVLFLLVMVVIFFVIVVAEGWDICVSSGF